MGNKPGFVGSIISALFATFLTLCLALLTLNKLTIWAQLGSSERFWTIFASGYAVSLTASGWIYLITRINVAGLVHSALMLIISGLVVFAILSGKVTGPGRDDAAAGIVAGANLLFILTGVVAGVCGVSVLRLLSSGKAAE